MTSIAALHWGSKQGTSFSIHQQAEILKIDKLAHNEPSNINDVEKKMLHEFFSFVRQRLDANWVHWNMRDSNYGFEALAHRYRVLGGEPEMIPESHLFDLASALVDVYGPHYCSHPHMWALAELNGITLSDFLDGETEDKKYQNGEFVALHFSTARKVRIISKVADLEWTRRLKTRATFWERHGSSIAGLIEDATDHWYYKLAGGIALLFALLTVIWKAIG